MNITGDKDYDLILNECIKIIKTKGNDYSGDEDRLAEFRRSSKFNNISIKQVFGVHIFKHLTTLEKWIKNERLKGEPIEEKLKDIIVYCLMAYKIEKEQ